ncbi:hypothetical protein [Achromobacter ruhlandii]|uniref:hypothetical protein n=1 Tax=Achromobacter ruhlandii TaxID=72557 RepID=UPI001E3CBC80|nr:hypothetical protein [Achromobacter ruhlandii]
MRGQHAGDAADAAAGDLEQAMEQNQNAEGQAQDQLAGVVGFDRGGFLFMVVKGDAMRRFERTPSLWFPLPRRPARGGPL